MYNVRWFKVLVASVLLASLALVVSPKVADVSVSASSNCLAALRQGIGNVMPGQLSDREICYRLPQIQGSPSPFVAMSSPGTSEIRNPGLAAPAAVVQNAPDYTFRVKTHVEGHGP
jgi:hypothetical protein